MCAGYYADVAANRTGLNRIAIYGVWPNGGGDMYNGEGVVEMWRV
jgi:hypothetical protein